MRSANKLLLTKHKSKKLVGSAVVHRIRSKGLEYTSKQHQSQRNSLYLQDSLEDISFQSLLCVIHVNFPSDMYTFYDNNSFFIIIIIVYTFLQTLFYTIFITTLFNGNYIILLFIFWV